MCGPEFTRNRPLLFQYSRTKQVEFQEKHVRVQVHVLESDVLMLLAPPSYYLQDPILQLEFALLPPYPLQTAACGFLLDQL
jgi:hypothetical protein